MTGSGETLPQKILFLFVSILVTGSLILIMSTTLGQNDATPNFNLSGYTIREYAAHIAQNMQHNMHSLISTAQHISNSTVEAMSIPHFIAPSDPATVPVITASAVIPTTPAVHVKHTVSVKLSSSAAAVHTTPAHPHFHTTNTYAWGNCTWWVAILRAQIHQPIPNSWGNAATWATRAAADGYTVNHTPSPGAIMQTPYSDGGLGHVAFVENVNPNGSWRISEMNVIGLDIVDHHTMPASAATTYNFIH